MSMLSINEMRLFNRKHVRLVRVISFFLLFVRDDHSDRAASNSCQFRDTLPFSRSYPDIRVYNIVLYNGYVIITRETCASRIESFPFPKQKTGERSFVNLRLLFFAFSFPIPRLARFSFQPREETYYIRPRISSLRNFRNLFPRLCTWFESNSNSSFGR